MAGIFISLEGPDGSGKSTAAQALVPLLEERTHKTVLLTREPGGSIISEKIRAIILDNDNTEMDAWTEALLYAAQRRQHLTDVILPALAADKIVLSDRYVDSSVAYQGAGRQLGMDKIASLNEFATQQVMPALTLYFDLDPKIGLQRIQKSTALTPDRLEQEDWLFYQRVQTGYSQICQQNPERIKKIAAQQKPEDVVADSLSTILDFMKG
ncbi:dTMP kinase [Bombilactobacillus thymidiniphilus]|uniref:Thymidylate kinase n=1 Tax=Bombilactobacillus thymidiniphilus TaxID=2923363 RepID=A0ABY4PEG1_9LACO|nr:dTMP kinase [Bombilactobacillus thymidiniphilus]UQS83932.1 dTMP kinase [Bombilactobacillus thymidiniphilus]